MDFDKYVDDLTNKSLLLMFKNMEEDCKSDDNSAFIKDFISYLENKEKNIKSKNKNISSDLNERLSKNDNLMFKKHWNKLLPQHKKQKLNEYLLNYLFDTSKENLNSIKIEIDKDFENKKLNSSKNVIYDPISMQVLNIIGLDYDSKTQTYTYKAKS